MTTELTRMPSFDQELAQHAGFLRRLAGRLTHDDAAADDLAQDTLALALEGGSGPPRHLPSWLATIATRRASNGRRSARRARDARALLGRDRGSHARREGTSAAQMASQIDLAKRLMAHVEALDDPLRDALYLRYFEGLAPRQIAQQLGIPTGTVKTRLARGLERLRERLDADSDRGREAWFGLAAAVGDLRAPAAAQGAHASGWMILAGLGAAIACGWFAVARLAPRSAAATAEPTVAALSNPPSALASGIAPLGAVQQTSSPEAAPRVDARKTVTFSGRVLDARTTSSDSELVDAARVEVRFAVPGDAPNAASESPANPPSVDSNPDQLSALGYASGTAPSIQWMTAVTNEDGSFAAALPPGVTTNDVTRVEVRGSTTHRGARRSSGDPDAAATLIRRPRGQQQGVVLDLMNQPVEGIRVEGVQRNGEQIVRDVAISGPDGRFTLSEHFEPLWFSVKDDTRACLARTDPKQCEFGGFVDAEIRVAERGKLQLEFVDTEGKPVPSPGAIVFVAHHELGSQGRRFAQSGQRDTHAQLMPGDTTVEVIAGVELMVFTEDQIYGRIVDGNVVARTDSSRGAPILVQAGQAASLRVVLDGSALEEPGDIPGAKHRNNGETTLRLHVEATRGTVSDLLLRVGRPANSEAVVPTADATDDRAFTTDIADGRVAWATSGRLALDGVDATLERHRRVVGDTIELRLQSGPAWLDVTGGARRTTWNGFTSDALGPRSSGWIELKPGVLDLSITLPTRIETYGRVKPLRGGGEACVALASERGVPIVTFNGRAAPSSIVEVGAQGHFSILSVPEGTYEMWVGTHDELSRSAPQRRTRVTVRPDEHNMCRLTP